MSEALVENSFELVLRLDGPRENGHRAESDDREDGERHNHLDQGESPGAS